MAGIEKARSVSSLKMLRADKYIGLFFYGYFLSGNVVAVIKFNYI